MKYYLIVGEASGDLHASHLMRSLQKEDPKAEFRFFGGDLMSVVGGTRVRHYKDLAYMGLVPVLLHLPTIFRNMAFCKRDISEWKPDVVILVDYPSFNLKIAKYVKSHSICPVYYYISPKIWAWKEWRIKSIKRDVDQLFSILPFEVDFYERKHHYPIHYVGNPTAHEVRQFRQDYHESFEEFVGQSDHRPIIALLAGSRKQEIKDNLPAMIEASVPYSEEYQLIVAGAPGIEKDYYTPFIQGKPVTLVMNQTWPLLTHSTAALVTSGTATLETALFNIPQVVCYKLALPGVILRILRMIITCRFYSLVNLIADREVVKELYAEKFSVDNIRNELYRLLPGHDVRTTMLWDYREIQKRLGNEVAPDNAARLIIQYLKDYYKIR